VAYLVGKARICPLSEEFEGESIYGGCFRLREGSKKYMSKIMRKRNLQFYNPSQDAIPEEESGYRTICPFFIRTREAFDMNGKDFFKRSAAAVELSEKLMKEVYPPEKLMEACDGLCPYEIMSLCAKSSQIVIMNYSHIFSQEFFDSMFQWLEIDTTEATLIIDEAHNLGDAVRSMNARALTMRMIELSSKEIEKFENALGQSRLGEAETSWRRKGVPIIKLLLPRLQRFIESREKRSPEGESILDTDLFRKFLYDGIEDIDDALSTVSEVAIAISEMKLSMGDRETAQGDLQPSLAQVLLFLQDIEESEKDISIQNRIVVSSFGDKRRARLDVVRIDPSPLIRRVVDNLHSTVMLSGTFSPLDAYELYCLSEADRAKKLSLPNPFPAENRLLMVSELATTQLQDRDDPENRREIAAYIESLIEEVPGNVAVFFTSYSMMNGYTEVCRRSANRAGKALFVEPRSAEEVPTILDEFFLKGKGKGGVLLGVSGAKLAEGIDYKGDALHGVAVVGLPLSAFDEIEKGIIAYYIRRYGREKGTLIAYTLPAINRALQAAGRVIRDASERGVILFCDRRLGIKGPGGVKGYLPGWIQKEMISCRAADSRGLISEARKKWQKRPEGPQKA
jgi:DNA excision repair protein ERCC-2